MDLGCVYDGSLLEEPLVNLHPWCDLELQVGSSCFGLGFLAFENVTSCTNAMEAYCLVKPCHRLPMFIRILLLILAYFHLAWESRACIDWRRLQPDAHLFGLGKYYITQWNIFLSKHPPECIVRGLLLGATFSLGLNVLFLLFGLYFCLSIVRPQYELLVGCLILVHINGRCLAF